MALKGCPKYGGRKKGTRNKSSLPLQEIANEMGCNPFKILCQFAMGDWAGLGYQGRTETRYTRAGESYEIEIITADHRLKAASEACQYLNPKRKAIEVRETKDPNEDRPLRDVSDEELDNM